MTVAEIQLEALSRARHGQSMSNYPAIFAGFTARGIPEADIDPRQNVLTYRAWQAIGRQVRRGEHGVTVSTFIPIAEKRDASTGAVVRAAGRAPRTTTVFHVSQTDPI
jgi:hypothetical protein